MNKKVVLFDIDYTLFNAKTYREDFLKKIFEYIRYDNWESFLEHAMQAYEENKKGYGYFEPRYFLEKLEGRLGKKLPLDKLEEIFTKEDVLKGSLYDETFSVIQTLGKRPDVELGIFSAGKRDIQHPKIRPVEEFFRKEHIHIVEFNKNEALPEIIKKYASSKLFLIDDILEVLYNAKKLDKELVTVWVKRGPYSYQQKVSDTFIPDYTVANLADVTRIVDQN